MSVISGKEAPAQPLPAHVQERIWWFVRQQIQRYETRVGHKVAEFEVNVTDAGQIEVAVLATENERSSEIDEGLEDAGLKDHVNRLPQREVLHEEIVEQQNRLP